MAAFRTVRVPASSANLGPGFDALAVALSIYLTCHFRPAGRLSIQVSGRDAALIPTGETNLIWRTAVEAARAAGSELPPLEIQIENEIPVGKGLGSSAAAIVAALVVADSVLDLGWSRERVLDEAAKLEGHPDNVAACILGSVVASAMDRQGCAHAVRLEMPNGFRVAAVVPNYELPTAEMRAVLPGAYSSADAVFNLQRAVLLVAALSTGDRRAFPTALEDRIHQPYRSGVVPGLEEILALRAPGLLGCALSGAGPAVLAFLEKGAESCAELVRQIFRRRGLEAEILEAQVSSEGYSVL
ncbi:MAG: homoserine kinase [Acidobacteria bacterium]|nr:homoserine kinase [Acidobacteriota bacterium]